MIDFKNVSKIYPKDIVALDDINLLIEPKEFTFIVGPSGAGKSTLLKLLIRQDFPTQGEIFFEDVDVIKIPKKLISVYRQQMGVAFQDLKLIECRTTRENIEFALEIIGKPKKESIETTEYLLDLVDLRDKSELFPKQLSGGEKQKVAIARAIANNPKVLIADEPTGNLDPNSALEILDILNTINELGTTVLAITHDHDIVNKMSKRVIALEKGKIVHDKKGGYRYIEKKDEEKNKEGTKKEVKKSKKAVKKTKDKSEITLLKLTKRLEEKLLKNKFDTFDKLLEITEEDIEKIGITEKQLEEMTKAIAKLKDKENGS